MRDVTPDWTAVLLVCANERDPGGSKAFCGQHRGREIRRELRDRVRAAGLKDAVLVSTVRCLGVCPDTGTTVCALPNASSGRQRLTAVVAADDDFDAVWLRLLACLDKVDA